MKFAIVYNKEIKNYDFGQGHPLHGNRFENFMKFLKPIISKYTSFEIVESKQATENYLKLVHEKEYIEFIETLSRGGGHQKEASFNPDFFCFQESLNL